MNKGEELTIAVKLSNWVESLCFSAVPEAVRLAAKRCIIDTLGVAVAGSRMPVAARLSAHVTQQYSNYPCTILGRECHISSIGAALANGTSAHVLDFDDTSYPGPVHASTVILPAVLAACEQSAANGELFLEAFIAGSETEYALSWTLTESHWLSGWWATGTLGAIGAAAGTAKVLGLAAEEITAAIAFAAIQANGMVAMLGYDAKPILAGQAARLGLESAMLASQGNTAPEHAFEDPRGFLKLMNQGKSDDIGLSELGKVWRLVDPGIFVKHAPVCSAAQAAIQLTETLLEQNSINHTQILRVRCEVPHLVKVSLVHDCPTTFSEAQFSMPFAIGCILAFGALGPEHISDQILANDDLRRAMAKVKMVESDDLNGADFQPRYPECARVTINAADGGNYTGFLGAPVGMPENPTSDEALSDKFRHCVTFAGWSKEKCETVLEDLWDIEHAPNLSRLLRGEIK